MIQNVDKGLPRCPLWIQNWALLYKNISESLESVLPCELFEQYYFNRFFCNCASIPWAICSSLSVFLALVFQSVLWYLLFFQVIVQFHLCIFYHILLMYFGLICLTYFFHGDNMSIWECKHMNTSPVMASSLLRKIASLICFIKENDCL